MLELIKELMEREWQFELVTGPDGLGSDWQDAYHLHMYLGNEEHKVYNDADAISLLTEIKTYW
jgi:hypothetical protein